MGYEPTPGISGSVTGRLASFQLPTGGTTSWVYTGGSHGINCADGTTSGIQMTTPDGVSTFTHIVNTNTTSTTSVTDAAGNLTTSQFYYGTNTEITNPLKTEILCYNGASTSCTNGSEFNGATPGYLGEVKTFTSISGIAAPSLSDVQFDPYLYGLIVQDAEYDFGPQLVSTSAITYGTSCGGSSVTHDRPCSLLTTDTSGVQMSNELDSYNALGDLIRQQLWVSGSIFLTTQYNVTNGIVNSVIDPNGKTTSYTNGGCNGMFPTAILYPTGNTSSIVWDCNGALVTSTIDPNGQKGTMKYDLLWRPLQSQDPLSNVTNYSYTATAAHPRTVFNSGNSALDIRFTTDSMGRMQVAQTAQGPGRSTYDTISQMFGPNGKTTSISAPCSTSVPGSLCSTSAYQFLYDALGRVTRVTNANTGSLTTTWQLGDALEVLGPVAIGETATKQKQLEYDGLNRLTSVCEITGATGSGPCNQRVAATGFLTSYTLDALGRVRKVTQGVQTRTFTYDGLGRLTTAVAPENGTTTYTYDTADTSCSSYSSPGDLVEKKDAMGNVSCYQYDSGHRLTSRSY
jgi:YD repeat-containing protein